MMGEWTTLLFISHSPLTIEIFLINLLRIHNVQCKDSKCTLYRVLSCIYLFSVSIKWTMDSPKQITIIRSLSQNRFYPHIRSSQFVYTVYWSDRSNATPKPYKRYVEKQPIQLNWIQKICSCFRVHVFLLIQMSLITFWIWDVNSSNKKVEWNLKEWRLWVKNWQSNQTNVQKHLFFRHTKEDYVFLFCYWKTYRSFVSEFMYIWKYFREKNVYIEIPQNSGIDLKSYHRIILDVFIICRQRFIPIE